MSVGLRVRDPNTGAIKLEITDRITRLRYSTIAEAENDGSISLSDISGMDSVQFAVPVEASKIAHKVERSGTTINWTAQTNGLHPSGDSLVIVFLYT